MASRLLPAAAPAAPWPACGCSWPDKHLGAGVNCYDLAPAALFAVALIGAQRINICWPPKMLFV